MTGDLRPASAAAGWDVYARLIAVAAFEPVCLARQHHLHLQVADGASQLMLDVLGAAGSHARSTMGVAAPPLGTPVEVEAIAQVSVGADEEAQPQ